MNEVVNNLNMYVSKLRIFWISFNDLEIMLRSYLGRKSAIGTSSFITCINSDAGDLLPACPITNYKTFKMLCTEYNRDKSITEKIDFAELTALRDDMAHGRVKGDSAGNMIVVKHLKPIGKNVTIEFKRTLTFGYLDGIIHFMNDATHKISRFIEPHMKD